MLHTYSPLDDVQEAKQALSAALTEMRVGAAPDVSSPAFIPTKSGGLPGREQRESNLSLRVQNDTWFLLFWCANIEKQVQQAEKERERERET
eukprot:CAMPEP_0177679714 /NCGR_PEP_ID=MMETSP0447-20121125/29755_1 /TAXON_ID=0 /ORGANISM="Stygamoeba regulata, Strain BSH-02190019" /LENGTH=91 /DNA_ID=CAMNT_0019188933 /DNA_START=24 /DNA_END=296 /DNA_ORIENTATION=-